jgi:hypothetical protein
MQPRMAAGPVVPRGSRLTRPRYIRLCRRAQARHEQSSPACRKAQRHAEPSSDPPAPKADPRRWLSDDSTTGGGCEQVRPARAGGSPARGRGSSSTCVHLPPHLASTQATSTTKRPVSTRRNQPPAPARIVSDGLDHGDRVRAARGLPLDGRHFGMKRRIPHAV